MTKSATREAADEVSAPIASPSFTGNVGINNSSPTQRLEINGNSQFNMYDNGSGGGGYYTTKGLQIGNAFDAGLSGGDDDRNAIVWNERGTSLLFATNNIEHMRINADGIVTKPLQPAFSSYANTQNNMGINAWLQIAFANQQFDQNQDYASNTFVAPVTGKYQLQISVRLDNLDTNTQYYQVRIRTSNRSYPSICDFDGMSTDPSYWNFNNAVLADMDANDTCVIEFLQAGGNSQTDINDESYFNGFLAC